MKRPGGLLPLLVLALVGAFFAGQSLPPRDEPEGPRLQAFGRLPVVYQGRVKPFDTLARNALVLLSERQTWEDERGERQNALRWLLDCIAQSPESEKHRVFRITNLELLDKLGLEHRTGSFRYALNEFEAKLESMDRETERIHRLEASQRDAFDNQVMDLAVKLQLYRTLEAAHSVPDLSKKEHLQAELQRQERLSRQNLAHAIPPIGQGEEWQPFMRAALIAAMGRKDSPALRHFAKMLDSWRDKDYAAFNASLAEYESLLAAAPPTDAGRLGFESFFNRLDPFIRCAYLYVAAFLLGCLSWLAWQRPLQRAAFWLMAAVLLVHTFALGARIYISGYPPVTNLYSSAIFIAWGAVALGLAVEVIFPLGVGNMVASLCGFLSLIVAHYLSLDGDTMQMMQAVLDTKFWLATHVVTVAIGYIATFLAGGLGMAYILFGLLSKRDFGSLNGPLYRAIYGVVCFGLLLSFVGTVLGGLWADDSWGRFWGWDPKENGALMIVLWNALALHARWVGMVRARGLAVLAVGGNIVTAWSWFGVNQLGVGLHSYGFTNSAAMWIMIFVATQLLFIGLGLIPLHYWRGLQAQGREGLESDRPSAPSGMPLNPLHGSSQG